MVSDSSDETDDDDDSNYDANNDVDGAGPGAVDVDGAVVGDEVGAVSAAVAKLRMTMESATTTSWMGSLLSRLLPSLVSDGLTM